MAGTDGAAPRLIAEYAQALAWAPDGQSLIAATYEAGSKPAYCKINVRSGERVRLPYVAYTDELGVSADRQWLAFYRSTSTNNGRISMVRLDGGRSQQQPSVIIDDVPSLSHVGFSPEGRFLYWMSDRDGRDCVYGVPLDPAAKRPTSPPLEVAHLHQRARLTGHYNLPFRFDNNQLLLPLTESTSDIWLRQLRD